jgi:hypothetical protein
VNFFVNKEGKPLRFSPFSRPQNCRAGKCSFFVFFLFEIYFSQGHCEVSSYKQQTSGSMTFCLSTKIVADQSAAKFLNQIPEMVWVNSSNP